MEILQNGTVYFSLISVGSFVSVCFTTIIFILLYKSPDKSRASVHLTLIMFYEAIHNLCFVIKFGTVGVTSAYATAIGIFGSLMAMTHTVLFFLSFPDRTASFHKALIKILYGINILITILFIINTARAGVYFENETGIFESLAKKTYGVFIVILLAWFVFFVMSAIIRYIRSETVIKKNILILTIMCIGIGLAPSILNILKNENLFNHKVYYTLWNILCITGWFAVVVYYINVTKDKISLLFKIISISVAAFSVIALLFVFFGIDQKEKSYQNIRQSYSANIVNNTPPYPDDFLFMEPVTKLDTKKLIYRDKKISYLFYTIDNRGQYYRVGFDYIKYTKFINDIGLYYILIIIFGFIFLSIGYQLFFRRAIIIPIKDLITAINNSEKLKTKNPVPVYSKDEIGYIAHSYNIARDKLYASQKELTESEANYRNILENIQDVFYRSNAKGELVMASPSMLKLTGYNSLDECIGKPIAETFYHNPIKRQEFIDEIKKTGSLTDYEVVLKRKDGTPIIAETNSHILYDEDGKFAGIEGILRDVTDKRNLEESRLKLENQLIQAQKMESVGHLAGGIAHDFNNMLTPILGYAEILKLQFPEGDENYNYILEIIKASERSRDLVRQLLAFARKQTLEMKPVDLNYVINNFEKMLYRILHENVSLTKKLDGAIGPIMADVGQLEQIILNLVVNAQDAMPDGGSLFIETTQSDLDENYAKGLDIKPGVYNLLQISDTGSGMDKNTIKMIFDPFFTTKGTKGTGLGLATVYGIVKQHSGHISVYSEPGKGTSFNIYFPKYDNIIVDEKKDTSLSNINKGWETILIVEDQDQVRNLAQKVLKNEGYNTIESASMQTAISISENFDDTIHLLITDVVLSDGNGKILHEKLLSKRKNLKVLFMSGYTSNVITHHGVLESGINFIQKPFSIKSFIRKVRDVLESN